MYLLDANAFMDASRLYYAFDIALGFWTWLGDIADSIDSLDAMTQLAAWATDTDRRFRQDAVEEFFGSADLRLIAQAMSTGATVVTREQSAPDSKKKIKIPDACNTFGVAWTDPFSLYRILGMRLVA